MRKIGMPQQRASPSLPSLIALSHTTVSKGVSTDTCSGKTPTPPPNTFTHSREDVQNSLYGYFGPPDDASDKERSDWDAWRAAIDNRRPQSEIDDLKRALQAAIYARQVQSLPNPKTWAERNRFGL
jgi:hypothetical protein